MTAWYRAADFSGEMLASCLDSQVAGYTCSLRVRFQRGVFYPQQHRLRSIFRIAELIRLLII